MVWRAMIWVVVLTSFCLRLGMTTEGWGKKKEAFKILATAARTLSMTLAINFRVGSLSREKMA